MWWKCLRGVGGEKSDSLSLPLRRGAWSRAAQATRSRSGGGRSAIISDEQFLTLRTQGPFAASEIP